MRMPVPLRSRLRTTLRGYHLEDLTVGAAEEEALERRRPQRRDQGGAEVLQPPLQPVELGPRDGDGDVPAELGLEGRRLEAGHLDQVQLLARRDLQPGRRAADVAGPGQRAPAQRSGEE